MALLVTAAASVSARGGLGKSGGIVGHVLITRTVCPSVHAEGGKAVTEVSDVRDSLAPLTAEVGANR